MKIGLIEHLIILLCGDGLGVVSNQPPPELLLSPAVSVLYDLVQVPGA